MTNRRTLAAVLLASALAAGTAYAADDSAGAAPAVTITQAIATAESQANGRAVEAELERGRGARGPYYEVKVIGADGVRRKVHVDATDGTVLSIREKHRSGR